MIVQALVYFVVCFTVLNLWLVSQLKGLSDSGDEPKKGRVVLKGLVAHFGFSILVLIVYHQLIYRDNTAEVLVALAIYLVSFIHYVAAATRVK